MNQKGRGKKRVATSRGRRGRGPSRPVKRGRKTDNSLSSIHALFMSKDDDADDVNDNEDDNDGPSRRTAKLQVCFLLFPLQMTISDAKFVGRLFYN